MKTNMKINFKPQYVLTYIPKGRKTRKTEGFFALKHENLTPMEILIKAKKEGKTPVNLRPDPDCPVVIVLSWKA